MGYDKHRRQSTSSSCRSSSPEYRIDPDAAIASKSEKKKAKKHVTSRDSSDSDRSENHYNQRSKLSKKIKDEDSGECQPKKRKKHKVEKPEEKENTIDNSAPAESVKPSTAVTLRIEEAKEVSPKNCGSSSSCDGAILFAEVICEFADFATSLAQRISNRAEYPWTPRILLEAKGKLTKDHKVKEPKDPNEPRRPLSSYTLWSNHIRKKIKEQQPDRPALKMGELSDLWKQVPLEQRAKWEQAAKLERDQYNKELEAYKSSNKKML